MNFFRIQNEKLLKNNILLNQLKIHLNNIQKLSDSFFNIFKKLLKKIRGCHFKILKITKNNQEQILNSLKSYIFKYPITKNF